MGGIQAVLFDYGGTLATFDYPTEALLDVLRRFRPRIEAALGVPAPEAERILDDVLLPLEEYIGSISQDEVDYMEVYRETWHGAGFRLPDPLLHEILDAEQQCWDRAARIDPEAVPLLDWLQQRGVKRGICSNAPFPPQMMRRQLDFTGLARHVDAIVFSSELGKRKPAPEVYRAALDAVHSTAEATLFVGDRVREDYEGPTAVGMRAVIVAANNQVGDGVPTIRSLGEVRGLV